MSTDRKPHECHCDHPRYHKEQVVVGGGHGCWCVIAHSFLRHGWVPPREEKR